MSNLSTAALVANEIAKVVDFSYANDQSISNISLAIRAIMALEDTDYVIGGKVQQYPSGGMNFIIDPIYGHCKASDIDIIDTKKTPQPISVESAHATMDRFDTVQVRGKEVFSDYQLRKFKNPGTGIISTDTIATKKHFAFEVVVKKGANGSVTAPLTDNGWIKLAEIFIPAGTVNITNEHIRNITARSSSHENTAWTIDKNRTFNPGYLSEVITKLLSAHKEDGSHKANSIKAEHIKFGIEEGDINGKKLPVGESMALRGENYSSQIPMTTIISAIAAVLNSAFPYINNLLGRYSFIDNLPAAASVGNVDVVTGGTKLIDGISCTAGKMVFLKDQTNKKQNGLWVVQSSAWNRAAGYTNAVKGCFDSKLILIENGNVNKGKIFYLENDTYEVDTDPMDFKESIFSTIDLPGKILIRDKNGRTIDDDKREKAIEGALLDVDKRAKAIEDALLDVIDKMEKAIEDALFDVDGHPTMVEEEGRNLLEVLGVSTIPEAMAKIRRRCNNNGEIDSTKVPNFRGIRIGDYLDGMNLNGVANAPGGSVSQAWNEEYKNNRIVVSGFNTYKNAGNTENVKNHVLFTFRNCICQGRMRLTDTNDGGYTSAEADKSEMRRWLEGAAGDGTGALAIKLKSELGGNYLHTIKKAHSIKGLTSSSGEPAWGSYTLWLPSELEVFGVDSYGDDNKNSWNSNVQFPIYRDSCVYRVKRSNGSRLSWWLMTPVANGSSHFAHVGSNGASSYTLARSNLGVAPAFCVA